MPSDKTAEHLAAYTHISWDVSAGPPMSTSIEKLKKVRAVRVLSGQRLYQEDLWLHAPQEKDCAQHMLWISIPKMFLQGLNNIMLLQLQSLFL